MVFLVVASCLTKSTSFLENFSPFLSQIVGGCERKGVTVQNSYEKGCKSKMAAGMAAILGDLNKILKNSGYFEQLR
jgi:hypothetical protein